MPHHPHHPQHPRRLRPAMLLSSALLALGLSLTSAAPALAAGPPLVQSASVSQVTSTAATLKATISPNGVKTSVYHFQYTTLAQFKASGFAGAAETPDGPPLAPGAEPTSFSAEITGLQPATAYRFRVFAENTKHEKTESPPVAFATYAVPLLGLPDGRAYEQSSPLDKNGADITGSVSFAKAAADGDGVSFAGVSGLPGGEGTQNFPPSYLATRSGEGSAASWSSGGLLPPTAIAPIGELLSWTPDFSRVYQKAARFGAGGLESALLERPGPGGPVTQITPFVPKAGLAFAGASADGSEAVFESRSAQMGTTPAGVEGRSNVYAWDAGAESLSLVSRMNTDAETETALPAGAFAGPYDWARGVTNEGGAARLYYLRDTHAIAADGSVFFTAAGSGHLYERLNPTEPQSAMAGKECSEAAKACTIEVSASQRETPDAGGPRPAVFHYATPDGSAALFTSSQKLTDDATTGPEVPPAAIGRLTLDGEENLEEEKDDYLPGAHATGVAVDGNHIYWVEPNKGTIARATLNGSGTPTEVDETFIDVAAEETCFETRPFLEKGVEQCAPSTPRYVAVHNGYVYWTNTGPLGGEFNFKPTEAPVIAAGTIGRAKINPLSEEAEQIEPAFIHGEEVKPGEYLGPSDPQGIAVNSEHIYWANSLRERERPSRESIARAAIGGTEVEEEFVPLFNRPFGLALSATRVYWASEAAENVANLIESVPLEGGSLELLSTGQHLETRGVAVAGLHLYWTDQATGTIGRVQLPLEEPTDGSCGEIPRCESEFIKPGGAVLGLAADAPGSHLYWSANGEAPPHPGSDLYRFRRQGTGGCVQAPGCLEDLTVDGADEDGAEVLGVAGASTDASRVYFVANAVLSEAPNEAGEVATPGDCPRNFAAISGHCNLYLWEGGDVRFIARLNPEHQLTSDLNDWLPTIANGVMGGPAGSQQKAAFASADGTTLLFRSQEKLTSYENEGVAELYLYRLGKGIDCVSCDPTGAPPSDPATLGTIKPPLLAAADTTALASRNLSADGGRAFFESTDQLVASDTNGSGGCPPVGTGRFPSCLDVYEWEAVGEGSCEEGAPAYSPASQGCLYLISSGKSDYPSFFLDASENGNDAFFFTRSQLVGQDTDQLLDVYDARVGGGIAAQSPSPPEECEGEPCKPGATPPPTASSPATSGFQGEGNVHEKPPKPCPKGKVRRHGKCVKKHKHRKHRKHNRTDRASRGGSR